MLFELDIVPNVQVLLCADTEELSVTTPPNAQPFEPLPGALAPGIPEPPYAIDISNHPFNDDVESITVPGNATQRPAIVPVNLILNFDRDVLTNLNVKYCALERPELKLGPAGK